MQVAVFTNVAADANSGDFVSNGRKALLLAAGTWGSGTITIKLKLPDNSYAVLSPSLTLNANGYVTIDLPKGATYRAELSGSTNPTLSANLIIDERN